MRTKDEVRREYVRLGYMLPIINDAGIRSNVQARMEMLEWVLCNEAFNIEEYEDEDPDQEHEDIFDDEK